MIKSLLRRLIFSIIGKSYLASSDAYINMLRKKGIKVGDGCTVLDPTKVRVDVSRPELLEIGSNVFLHVDTKILTHDWASWCFVNKFSDFLPSCGPIKIGNNVWLGENVTILKGVTIGDNVIIGAGSIITKSIPSDSVAVGAPAKVICSLDEYYKKRKEQSVEETIDYAISIYDSGRTPQVADFYDNYPAFVDGRNWSEYNYPYNRIFNSEQFEDWKKHHIAPFNGFNDFISAVNERRNK